MANSPMAILIHRRYSTDMPGADLGGVPTKSLRVFMGCPREGPPGIWQGFRLTSPPWGLQSGPGGYYDKAMTETFESTLQARVDAMLDACTRCGKCVEVCPAAEPAGLGTQARENPASVIGGVIDLL